AFHSLGESASCMTHQPSTSAMTQRSPALGHRARDVLAHHSLFETHLSLHLRRRKAIDDAQNESLARLRRQRRNGRLHDVALLSGHHQARECWVLRNFVKELNGGSIAHGTATQSVNCQICRGLEQIGSQQTDSPWLLELQESHIRLLRDIVRLLDGAQPSDQKSHE